jgi:hypothetical protein
MKEQTYIVFLVDDEGNKVDFERFSYKRIETVKRAMQQLLSNSLYRVLNKTATKIEIYKTAYSIEGLEPVETIAI